MKSLSILSLALLLTGCASIVSDSSYAVTVTSSDDGVPVSIRNENGTVVHKATTPFTVELAAEDGYFDGMDYTVETSNGGVAHINSKIDGWYFGNLLVGVIIGGLIIDPLTGAMWKLPDTVYVEVPADAVDAR